MQDLFKVLQTDMLTTYWKIYIEKSQIPYVIPFSGESSFYEQSIWSSVNSFIYLINFLWGEEGGGWWISSFIIFKSNCCHWKYVFGAAVQNHTVSIISKQLNDFYSCFKHNSSAQFKHQSSSYNIHWTKHCLRFVFLNNFVDFRSIKFNREVSVFFFCKCITCEKSRLDTAGLMHSYTF